MRSVSGLADDTVRQQSEVSAVSLSDHAVGDIFWRWIFDSVSCTEVLERDFVCFFGFRLLVDWSQGFRLGSVVHVSQRHVSEAFLAKPITSRSVRRQVVVRLDVQHTIAVVLVVVVQSATKHSPTAGWIYWFLVLYRVPCFRNFYFSLFHRDTATQMTARE